MHLIATLVEWTLLSPNWSEYPWFYFRKNIRRILRMECQKLYFHLKENWKPNIKYQSSQEIKIEPVQNFFH